MLPVRIQALFLRAPTERMRLVFDGVNPMNSHRQRTKRKTVTWQAAAVALLAAGIGVGFLPLGAMFGPGKQVVPEPTVVATTVQKPQSMGAGAVHNLSENLKKLAGKRDVPPPPPPPDPNVTPPDDNSDPVPPPPVASTDWAYIGHMIGPTFRRAIVTVGSAESGAPQLSLGEGETHNGTKLVSIATDHIMVDPGDGNQKRIDLATRAAATSWNTDQPRRPIAARGVPGMPQMAGQNAMTPPGQGAGFTSPNAAAMAEAQRRMKAAISPPQPFQPPVEDRAQKYAELAKQMGELGPDKRESLMKTMTDPSISPEERTKILHEIGIPTDGTPDERGQFLEMIGVGPNNDPKLYELIREGGGSK